jgi:hypothetical protein
MNNYKFDADIMLSLERNHYTPKVLYTRRKKGAGKGRITKKVFQVKYTYFKMLKNRSPKTFGGVYSYDSKHCNIFESEVDAVEYYASKEK